MRDRVDENGKVIGAHKMVFDDIPDDFEVKHIIGGGSHDLSYLGVLKYLRNVKAGEEFENNIFYSREVLSVLSLDYLQSALLLQSEIEKERDGNSVSYYLIPCAFLCRHAIELKLKECLLVKNGRFEGTHIVKELWRSLNENDIINYEKLTLFIEELSLIDNNGIPLRYGISNDLQPLEEDFIFDVDALTSNAKYFFNVVDEYVICKYLYKNCTTLNEV